MRYTIIIFLSLLCHSVFGVEVAPQDSLLRILSHTSDPKLKISIYRNLADVYFELPQERSYLKLLAVEAKRNNDSEMLLSAYSDLTDSYIRAGESDSARLYLGQISQMVPDNATQCQLVYLNIRLFNSEIVKEGGIEAINTELKKQTDEKEGSVFSQIECAYNIASALEIQKKYHDALPYINTAVQLAATLPFKEACPLYIATMRLQQRILQLDGQSALLVPLIEKYAELQEAYYQKYLKDSRPFYPINGLRISDYTSLIINIRHLTPEKATYYLQKIIDLSNKSNRPIDKYRGFLSKNNYYLFKKEYQPALVANDSLIKYATVIAPYLLSYLHNVSSQIQEAMGNYKEALQSLQTSYTLQDSILSTKSAAQLNELQVQYDLNKLNYEKSQLEVKNKLIMLVSLSIVLLISLLISVYLYRNLKKEKAMKAHLRILKTKAEESENMKTVFINSICHEIRTPLNAIVGFTDLIFDTDVDEELKLAFPGEIQRNTRQLMSLINSMLEVSNLDVSDHKLPCALTDVSSICQFEMDRTMEIVARTDIKFHLNLPEIPLIIYTNEQYLSLVIENLLNNANKFTQNGDITLEYYGDTTSNMLYLIITDTGCGIPKEKHQEVFERFVKLDTFIPGNGLGLYLCQLIVNRLSGKIIIDSQYTQGTRVIVSLPLLES